MSTIGSPANAPENKLLYWVLWLIGIAIIGTMLLIAWLKQGVLLFKVGIVEFDYGLTALELAFSYAFLSLNKTVPADKTAGAYCYGKALTRLGSGPHFIPLGLMQLAVRSRLVQEFQCPGEPEAVFRGHDNEVLPAKMVRPVRVVTRAPKENENGILDTQMTLIISFVVQYVINDILDFNANFGSIEQVEKQVRDIGEILIAEIASTVTPDGFITQLPQTNETLRNHMKVRLDHLGVKIISVRMISPDVSLEVSQELSRIPIARAKAEQKVIDAMAEKTRLKEEGAGKASAIKETLFAEAAGQKKIAEDLDVDGSYILAAKTASALVNAGTVVVGASGGMQDLVGVVKAAQTALQPKGDNA